MDGLENHYLTVTQDITERKQTEKRLEIAEQNFRNSLDQSPVGVRIMISEDEISYANQAILDIYGYDTFDELMSTPVKQRLTPASYAQYLVMKERFKQGEPIPPVYDVEIVRKDGEIRNLAVSRTEVI